MQAAVQEINRRGLKFSIRDVTGRSGISTKTLYEQFPSKERLIECMVEQAIAAMKEKEQAIMQDGSLTVRQKLFAALVNVPSGFAFSDSRSLHDLKHLYPAQWRIMDVYINEGWDPIRSLIRDGIADGIFRPFDVQLFIDVFIGAFYYFMDAHHEATLEKALSQTAQLLLEGICANGEERL